MTLLMEAYGVKVTKIRVFFYKIYLKVKIFFLKQLSFIYKMCNRFAYEHDWDTDKRKH